MLDVIDYYISIMITMISIYSIFKVVEQINMGSPRKTVDTTTVECDDFPACTRMLSKKRLSKNDEHWMSFVEPYSWTKWDNISAV
jgi:hypothetical protein